jgi:hypothetical protein
MNSYAFQGYSSIPSIFLTVTATLSVIVASSRAYSRVRGLQSKKGLPCMCYDPLLGGVHTYTFILFYFIQLPRDLLVNDERTATLLQGYRIPCTPSNYRILNAFDQLLETHEAAIKAQQSLLACIEGIAGKHPECGIEIPELKAGMVVVSPLV